MSSVYFIERVIRCRQIIHYCGTGKTWKTYGYKWKPQNADEAPKWVQPYHPRFDWQMWFVPLGPHSKSPWIYNTTKKLLEGSPQVLGLFADNPFPDSPPRYIRTMAYDYTFTHPTTKKVTGDWWNRVSLGPFTPVMSLR